MGVSRTYKSPAFKRRIIAGDLPGWLLRHTRKDRIIALAMSVPDWVSHSDLSRFHEEAARLTRVTGIRHQVDHIVPVSHPLVCGLTVPWNLQILTFHDNSRKGNAWDDGPDCEQLELFQRPAIEQYELNI